MIGTKINNIFYPKNKIYSLTRDFFFWYGCVSITGKPKRFHLDAKILEFLGYFFESMG